MRCKLGDISEITKLAGYEFTKYVRYIPDGEIIAVRALNLKNGTLVLDDIQRISKEVSETLPRSQLHKNDIVLSYTGTLGECAQIQEEGKYHLAPNVCKITPNGSVVNPNFLFQYIRCDSFKQTLINYAHGSTQPTIPMSTIRDIPVVIPDDFEKQGKIAAILSALDEKIATNREINDNLQQQAASIFVEWLNTCTDFSTIGDMAHNILDYSPVGSEQIRLLNSSDVTEGVFPIAPLVPNKDLKGHFKKRFKFGDILYSEIRPRNHHYGFVLFDASDYIASTRLMVIRAIENKVSPAMLYQYLLLPEVEAEFTLKTESRSGTFPQGNYADMASIQVPYSPTNSQTAVSEILSRIRFAIAQNQFESQRLAELRDALLPKLMSGEIDVSAVQL